MKTNVFRELEVGDRVLFYREGRFISQARITLKIDTNRELADFIWGPDEDDGLFEHIFFLEKPSQIDVPYSAVWNITEHGVENALLGVKAVPAEHTEEVSRALALEMSPGRDPVQESAAKASEQAMESGQGYAGSAAVRKALEDHSMAWAKEYFRGKGFDVDDVSSSKPYDLRCEQSDLTMHVEVKRTQTLGKQVNLTRNEVEFAREHAERMVLFIVHSIEVEEKDDGTVATEGGTRELFQPWYVDDGMLQVINYKYTIPDYN